jgi:formylglycine-generating enzyme required for sulfatase activity
MSLEPIQRYAKPLFCPDDMLIVDVPPGVEGRPFFKVCIDKYEAPNRMDSLPNGGVSYYEAYKACESKGKRLCTADEWQWACSGLEGFPYPYGHTFSENTCNSKGVKALRGSGWFQNCKSKFGAYDMTGSVFEWVIGREGSPMLMGGSLSKCSTVSPGLDGSAKIQTGYRCCKSN